MPLYAIVALSLAAVAVFAAYRNEMLGKALAVGFAAIVAFYLVVAPGDPAQGVPDAPASPGPSLTSPSTPDVQPSPLGSSPYASAPPRR